VGFGEKMKNQINYPPGWDEARVHRVLAHYEEQSEEEAVAEDEAAFESLTQTAMKIPLDLGGHGGPPYRAKRRLKPAATKNK